MTGSGSDIIKDGPKKRKYQDMVVRGKENEQDLRLNELINGRASARKTCKMAMYDEGEVNDTTEAKESRRYQITLHVDNIVSHLHELCTILLV
jgi:hypothetical protein